MIDVTRLAEIEARAEWKRQHPLYRFGGVEDEDVQWLLDEIKRLHAALARSQPACLADRDPSAED